jgi:hypothetical protein
MSTVEAEVFIPPLDLHLDSVISRAIKRMEENGMAHQIEAACTAIRRKLHCWGQNQHIPLPAVAHPKPLPADWARAWVTPSETTTDRQQENPRVLERRELLRRWRIRWAVRKPPWGELFTAEPSSSVLKLHKGLSKAQSSIAIQLRSGKTGLAAFLHWRQVPGYPSPICPCGQGSETPKHVMIHCPKHTDTCHELETNGRVDLSQIMTTPVGIQRVTAWWLGHDILPQFQLASTLERGNLGNLGREERLRPE